MPTTEEILAELPATPEPAGLKPLFRGVWRLAPPLPAGPRVIIGITEGVIQGRGLTARLTGPAADWLTVAPDGIGTLDWRGQLVTDEGAVIYLHGTGRMDTTQGTGALAVGSCLFETGAKELRWLNTVQAVYRSRTVAFGTPEAAYHDEYFELV
ncbi:DUF3237 family protein [Actinomadura macrotermitis]|uniref:DUF3237 domain-containing protein n=1 Tax=Actinomadura macrotermitis TaxID=2585200 RepID=A0A7K0C3X5_9ACTN|nr:DUF3237 family protein [Actinomadura macrotermitis]MQY07504.1 hypothetical protein [Actinomadura macrotermitis]